MSHLALFLLGPPGIERDGVVINVDTRKATALIAYLAVTRQRHTRDALATLLWPEYDQTNARSALRRTLSTLNKALAGNWLDSEREAIGLTQSSSLWLDVDEFIKCLAESRMHAHPALETCPVCLKLLTEAVSLYRGDFMAGFGLRDSANFDDWQFFQADSLRSDLANAFEQLAHCHTIQNNFEAAITYARRWLALDQLHEPAHRYLMQLYAWAGQRSAAMRQYRECVQVLEQELGVSPLESTTQLYQLIKENHIPPPPIRPQVVVQEKTQGGGKQPGHPSPQGVSLPPPSPASYPLVGRSADWSTLLKVYSDIQSDGHVIVLAGEAGIGKTRLAEEFVTYVHTRGASKVTARCYEGETHLAYGPFVAGIRIAISQKQDNAWLENIPALWLSEAARLLPELSSLRPGLSAAPPLDNPGAQSRFFEGLRQVLLAVCGDDPTHPGIVFFDDVHWADGASLDLLAYLVRRLHEQPFCLLITYTTQHVSAYYKDHHLHHLHRLLADAQRTTVLSLTRLSQQTVQELVQLTAAPGTKLPGVFAERLYQETEGVPFFLREYLTAIANGVLAPGNDNWSLPGGVRDLLHARLHSVSEIGWQLLNTAAVIGSSFDFDTLREASGRSEEETITALEELIVLGLVNEVQRSPDEQSLTYDFSHEKLRALVYEETSLARRRLLHRRIAEVLVGQERGNRKSSVLPGQIASHYQLAGNETAAAEYYTLAGERARILYANAEALAHFRLALALGYRDTVTLHEAIGDLHTLMGEYPAALNSYETAAALCDHVLDKSALYERLSHIEHKLGNLYVRRGEWELAESHLEAALAVLGEAGPAGERAKIYADWSLAAHHRGQIEEASKLAHQALDLAETVHDTHALSQAHNILGILASSRGDANGARHHLERSLVLAESLNDPSIRAAALNNLALACAANGEVEPALSFAEAALTLCTAQRDRHREAALHNNLADILYAAGRAEEAMSHLKQAVSIYAEIGVEAGNVQPEIWKLAEW